MTEDEWLDTCADKPDDELRRLAFADWLEEKGDDDRAEFIRLQVCLSRQAQPAQDPTQAHRAAELLVRHRLDWLGPLVEVADAAAWRFPRGLPDWLDLGSRVIRDAGVAALAASPHCHRLVTLDLSRNGIQERGAAKLADTPHLKRLTTLILHYNVIGEAGVTALASNRHLNRLTTLDLSRTAVREPAAIALAKSPRLTQLLELHLWDNPAIGEAGKAALARAFCDRVHF
jgi:uncharacterized protein (TIGR02996 family)